MLGGIYTVKLLYIGPRYNQCKSVKWDIIIPRIVHFTKYTVLYIILYGIYMSLLYSWIVSLPRYTPSNLLGIVPVYYQFGIVWIYNVSYVLVRGDDATKVVPRRPCASNVILGVTTGYRRSIYIYFIYTRFWGAPFGRPRFRTYWDLDFWTCGQCSYAISKILMFWKNNVLGNCHFGKSRF